MIDISITQNTNTFLCAKQITRPNPNINLSFNRIEKNMLASTCVYKMVKCEGILYLQ